MTALYAWPERTRVGSRLSKERFTRSAPQRVRKAFVDEVAAVVWGHKLGGPSLALTPSPEVPEIAVIEVVARDNDVSECVVQAVDRAIPLPVLFEVARPEEGRARLVATPQTAGTKAEGPWYSSAWSSTDARCPLPIASSLTALYLALLEPLLPAAPRAGESPAALQRRLVRIDGLERQTATLERRMRAEVQLNRQLALRRTLKTVQSELETLR